jgi:hypothetical protein
MVCTGRSLRTARRDSQFANASVSSHQQRPQGSVHPSPRQCLFRATRRITFKRPQAFAPSHEKTLFQARTSLFAKPIEASSSTHNIPTLERDQALRLGDTTDTHENGTSTSADTTSEEPGRLHRRPDVCFRHRAGCTHQDWIRTAGR